MANDDDGWGDLFAKAAGTEESITLPPEVKKKKKKRKRKRTDDDDKLFHEMLENRSSLDSSPERDTDESTSECYMIAYSILVALRQVAFQRATTKAVQRTLPDLRGLQTMVLPSGLEDTGEAQLVRLKRDQVLRLANSTTFDGSVRLMIACDDLYMRLYYLQVSGSFKADVYLPHPISYFSDNNPAFAKKLIALKKECSEYPAAAALFGLTDGQQHVLTKLHERRFLETHVLFGDYDAKGKELRRVLQNQSDDDHETPATLLISEWRNSCRDNLCNLYAYATIPGHVPTSLASRLKSMSVTKIVELGAGTGYIAKLIQDSMSIEAFDSAPPTDTANEYHGRTRPFLPIKQGTHQDVFQHASSSLNTALLLCYPPPDCSMAVDATKSFIKSGGNVLIHIGEFKGLTGSADFEQLILRKKFECTWRVPCLTWGTDAANVTIWKLRREPTKDPLLLPCLACYDREAAKRCRLMRHAVYCSKECFTGNAPEFNLICNLSLIPCPLDFDDKRHFQELPGRWD